MRVNESKKIGKISDELVTYLVKNGYEDISYRIKKDESTLSVFLEIADIKDVHEQALIYALDSQRNYDIEEFGWELLGESASANELELVGMLFDRFHYEKDNGVGKIRLVRNI